jgi:hypothetical protein
MKCIVPLAGPDIYSKEYGLKPAYEIEGKPLISRALNSRDWYGDSLNEDDLIFVLRDFEQLNELKQLLNECFPKGRQLILPNLTQGALLSSLAGISLIIDYEEEIVVDLVDILFHSDFNPTAIFRIGQNISGIIPYFNSESSKYSYLEIDDNHNILSTREKKVISNHASAGVYFFRNSLSLLKATAYSIEQRETLAFNNLLYLCPAFNGLNGAPWLVKAVKVDEIQDVSTLFH